jgi:hypothetical protein
VDDLPVTAEAIDLLWSVTRGRPFPIQVVAGRSFEYACAGQAAEVQACHVRRALDALQEEKHRCFSEE